MEPGLKNSFFFSYCSVPGLSCSRQDLLVEVLVEIRGI